MNAQLVVGWDGSPSSRRALEWALQQKTGPILLVQVVDGLDRFSGLDLTADPRAGAAVSLETAAADVEQTHPGAVVETRLLTGDPVDQLAALAGPDTLLVVGDRHRTVLPIRAGWSVGARLAAKAAGPVAIVPRTAPTHGSGVLVGIDDSDDARAALAFAAAWAARTEQPLTVLHAWRTPFLWSDSGTPSASLLDEVTAQHAAVLAAAVTEAREQQPGLVVEGVEVDGVAARALVEAASDRALLVVGDGGVHLLERLLIGSVSHDVLLNLLIPTVVVGRRAVSARPGPHVDAPPAIAPAGSPTVVAWDGSLPSRSAVEWALRREHAGSIDVVMVADEGASAPDSAGAAATVALDEREVDRMLGQVRDGAPDVAVHGRVVRGFVLHTLAALTGPGRLLVLGTEDREGPRLRFGLSVGAQLVALAHGPVAIIPRTVDTTSTGVAVGVDGSELSNAAVLVAAAEASRRGETLHLVHAWLQPTLYERSFLLDAEFLTALEDEHRAVLVQAEALVAAQSPGLTVESHLVVGPPAKVLAELTPRPATIVVGTRALSGWRRIVFGSVSHELILDLDVPLIVVGAPGAIAAETGVVVEQTVGAAS